MKLLKLFLLLILVNSGSMFAQLNISGNPPLPVAYGGTGAATLTGIVTGNGTAAFTATASPTVTTLTTTNIKGASNVVSFVNGTAAQEIDVYGTTTGSHYTYLTNNGSSGALFNYQDEPLTFGPNNGTRWQIRASGENYALIPAADNTNPIGSLSFRASAVNSPAFHSGASAMTFATSSSDTTVMTLQLIGSTVTGSWNTSGTGANWNGNGTVGLTGLTSSGSTQVNAVCHQADTTGGLLVADTVNCIASLRKYKNTITDIDSGLDLVMKLRPVNFYWNDKAEHGDKQMFGFIADDAVKIDERLGMYTPGGELRGFQYEMYTAVLTKAIQEMNATVLSQQIQINELKARLP